MPTCASCGGEVSDRADYCRHCSAPQRPDAGKVAPPVGEGLTSSSKAKRGINVPKLGNMPKVALPKIAMPKLGRKEKTPTEPPMTAYPPLDESAEPATPPAAQQPVDPDKPVIEEFVPLPRPVEPPPAPPAAEVAPPQAPPDAPPRAPTEAPVEQPTTPPRPQRPTPRRVPRAPGARPPEPEPEVVTPDAAPTPDASTTETSAQPMPGESAEQPAADPLRPRPRPSPPPRPTPAAGPAAPSAPPPPPPPAPPPSPPFGTPIDIGPPPLPVSRDEPDDEPPLVIIGRIAAVFAAVGFGLAVFATLMLWLNGFFDDVGGGGALDIGAFVSKAIGGVVLFAVFIFGMTLTTVLSAMAGQMAARSSPTQRDAIQLGATAAAAGYLAMLVVLGGILIAVLNVGFGSAADAASQIPLPTVAADQQAECFRQLGPNAEVCQQLGDLPNVPGDIAADIDTGAPTVSFGELAKATPGAIPAAIVGALVAAILFPRRRQDV